MTTTHCDKHGKPKILKSCSLPLTGHNVASVIITEKAVFRVKEGKLFLTEMAPGLTVADITNCTDASFTVDKNVSVMRQ